MEHESRTPDAQEEAPTVLTPEERRERNREEMIDAILQVSREIMREEGVGALSMHEIARRVGMTAPSLYNYFPSKMAIYEELFARGMRAYRERAVAVLEREGPLASGRRAALEHYMAFATENPELFHLLFERPVPGFKPSREGFEEIEKLIEMSDRIVAQQIEAGEIDESIPADQARDLFVAVMHGLTAMHMANEPELPVGKGRFGSLIPLAARAVDMLYEHGLTDEESGPSQRAD